MVKACVELKLENGNDAVFGALFSLMLFGGAGVVLFLLANTLNAMLGYKTERFLRFGWAAARIDDLLNYIPARLTALSYALFGETRRALSCWRKQAPVWESPNAGPVMSAGAGSLGFALGGAAYYHGQLEECPVLGEGRPARGEDIRRALRLLWLRAPCGWCCFSLEDWRVLEHGGRLHRAAQDYGIPFDEWIDLSTGINPREYPIPPINPACWNCLPEDDDALEAAVAAYYGNEQLLVLCGSQAAIQTLPALFKPGAVACISPMYEEHPHAWQRHGHKLRRLPNLTRALAASSTPIILLCNPNNPTGVSPPGNDLLDAAAQLQKRGGWLIVDEAFADHAPENCIVLLAGTPEMPNLIVLRSLGKFFGLAGARVGGLFGAEDIHNRMRELLGPWPVSNPSCVVARHALSDAVWQLDARSQLVADSLRLSALLAPLGDITRTALFCTLKLTDDETMTESLYALFEHLARHAILTRRFDQHGRLRFGLPENESEWQRLTQAIDQWSPTR